MFVRLLMSALRHWRSTRLPKTGGDRRAVHLRITIAPCVQRSQALAAPSPMLAPGCLGLRADRSGCPGAGLASASVHNGVFRGGGHRLKLSCKPCQSGSQALSYSKA
jgi:hypothetical protein